MKNVVENDAEQAVQKSEPSHGLPARKKPVYKKRTPPQRKGQIVSAPREKPGTPVSTRLTKAENAALGLCAAVRGKRSKSHVIRLAIQQFVARNGQVQVPLSLGVVDDIYPATVHHDVVELSNQLRALEYGLLTLVELASPSTDTKQLQLILADASSTLERIAGRVKKKS